MFSLVGNIINLVIYIKFRRLRTLYFRLVVYLSMVDITYALIRLIGFPQLLDNHKFCNFYVSIINKGIFSINISTFCSYYHFNNHILIVLN